MQLKAVMNTVAMHGEQINRKASNLDLAELAVATLPPESSILPPNIRADGSPCEGARANDVADKEGRSGLVTDTAKWTVKTLFSRLVTRKLSSPADSLRALRVRVEP
eukprot:98712-Prorocentrum_minimum.AAC.1